MFVFGVVVDSGGDSLPRLHVAVQLPLLLVHKALHVDTGDLTAVLEQLKLSL